MKTRRPKKIRKPAVHGLPDWLSAFVLLAAVVMAWLILRRVVPIPDSLVLPAAMACLAAGLACWWPIRMPPHARGRALRPFRLADALPVAAACAGLALLSAAIIGWGNAPLASLADTIASAVWKKPDQTAKENPQDKPPPDENPAPTGSGPDDWQQRPVPARLDGSPASAPAMLLTLPSKTDFDRLSRSPLYLRVAALDVFEAGTSHWLPLAVEPAALTDTGDGQDDGHVIDPLAVDALEPATVRYSVFTPLPTTIVPALQGAVAIEGETFTRLGEAVWSVDAPGKTSFQGLARPMTYGTPGAPDVVAGDTPENRQAWLALPDGDFGDRLRTMATTIGPSLSGSSRISALPVWLAQRCHYSLEVKNPGNRPPLVNFLDFERTGSCEHFAGAGVLLLRALGYPARIAYGYTGGTILAANQSISFGSQDYHAWAEIFLPHAGWMVVECTPPGAGANRPPATAPEESPEIAKPDVPAGESGQSGGGKSLTGLLATLAAALACLIAAWLAALWRGHRLGTTRASGKSGQAPAQPDYFLALLRACQAVGVPRRTGRTAREHLEFLTRARVATPAIAEIIAYYHQTRYDETARSPDREAVFLREIKAWQAATGSATPQQV